MSAARGPVILETSCVGPGDLGVAVVINGPSLNLLAGHDAVRLVQPRWGNTSSFHELRINQAGRLQFQVRQFTVRRNQTRTIIGAYGRDHLTPSIQRLMHCFAPSDRPTLEQQLAATTAARDRYGRDLDLVFGFDIPTRTIRVNRLHLKNELRVLLGELLATDPPSHEQAAPIAA